VFLGKYEKNIVTKFKLLPLEVLERTIKMRSTVVPTGVLYADRTKFENAFYVECNWFSKGTSEDPIELVHVHEFDEVLVFIGSDPENPHDLNGEVELWLDDEKYILKNTCAVFVPKGLKHCPLIFRRVEKPIIFVAFGPTPYYSRKEVGETPKQLH